MTIVSTITGCDYTTAADLAIATAQATAAMEFAANIAVCANCNNNWAANRVNADAAQSNAFAEADQIQLAANNLANEIRAIAIAAADAARDAPNPTWLIADWTAAYVYANADWTAANALAAMDWTAAYVLTAAIWRASNAEAAAQKVTARAVDAANVGNALDLVPATVKAYNDCVGVNLSATASADAIWAPAHVQANAIRHNATITTRSVWNASYHAADADMIKARAASYTGNWCIADWVAARAFADAQFVAGQILNTNNWNDAIAAANAAQTAAYVAYSSDSSKVAADQIAINADKVAADQFAANLAAAVAEANAHQIAVNLAADVLAQGTGC